MDIEGLATRGQPKGEVATLVGSKSRWNNEWRRMPEIGDWGRMDKIKQHLENSENKCPKQIHRNQMRHVRAVATIDNRLLIGTKASEIYEVNLLTNSSNNNKNEVYRLVEGHYEDRSEAHSHTHRTTEVKRFPHTLHLPRVLLL